MPAGQARGESGVLALLADGERKLVVRHNDAGVGLLLVNEDAGDLSGRQGVSDVDGRIGIPQDDVDALAAELDDHAHTAALRADAGAHGIQTVVERVDGDLGALAGLAGDRLDLDGALIDLGHLLLKQTTHELGVGTGDDNRRTAVLATNWLQVGVGVANVDDHGLDVLVVQVALAHRALVALVLVTALVEVRQLGLDALADLDDREVRRGLQHGAADEVTDTAGELLVDLLAGGVTHDGVDLGLRVLGSDAARVLGSDVDLLELGEVALLVHGIVDRLQAVDVDLAGGAVDSHLGAPLKMQDLGIALGE